MSSRRIGRTESVGDSLCPVCHEHTEIYAIGPCDHPICYKCSTRMRVLCNQMYCPICRGDLPQIVFLTAKRNYDELNRRDCIPNRKYKILLEDESVEEAYEALLEHRCRVCDKGPLFDSFRVLQSHMSRTHTLFACDLCINHLKIFPFERKFYNRKDLATHRRTGDTDNRSYRGHPLCRFCDERYMDNDELLRHLRKAHYFCHFCDTSNSNEYFNDYPDLKEHFRVEHFMCYEDECGHPNTQFTHAFASEIDLKAHQAAEHMGNKSRAQGKELRTINVDFQMAPRRRGHNAGGVISPEDYDEVNAAGRGQRDHRERRQRRNEPYPESYSRSDNSTPPPEPAPAPAPRPPVLGDEFPTLGNGPAPYVPAPKAAQRGEDFPSLSSQRQPQSTSACPSLASRAAKPGVGQQQRPGGSQKPKNNFSNMAGIVTSAEASRPNSSIVQSPRPGSTQSRPVEVSRPEPTATSSTWAGAKLTSAADFPSLGGDRKKKSAQEGPNYVRLGAWSKNQKDSSAGSRPSSARNGNPTAQSPQPTKSAPKSASLTALGRAFCDDGEFPTLGGVSGASPVGWVQKNGNSNKNKNKNKSSGSAPLGKTRDPTLSTKSKPEPVLVNRPSESNAEETKSKKKKKKQKGNKEESKASTEDSGISLSSIAGEIDAAAVQALSDPFATQWEEEEKKTDTQVLGSFSNNSVKLKETYTSSSPPQASLSSAAAVPSAAAEETPSPAEGKENNEQWEAVGSRKFKAFQEDDFPSLRAAPTKKTAPPPGFRKAGKVTAPPPGLNKPADKSSSVGRVPPGLSSSSSTTPAALAPAPSSAGSGNGGNRASLPLSVKLNLYTFAPPPNMAERNRALVARVRNLLEVKIAGFDQFRNLSVEYRSGVMTAQEYHRQCQDLFGKERFLEVLPELVVLLPDIVKQHELNQAHQLDILGICAPLSLQACATCQQLLKAEDLVPHCASHANLASDIGGFSAAAAAASRPIQT